MKNAGRALIDLLNSSQQFMMADLYTITLAGGGTARYTSNEGDLTVITNTVSKAASNYTWQWGRGTTAAGTGKYQVECLINAVGAYAPPLSSAMIGVALGSESLADGNFFGDSSTSVGLFFGYATNALYKNSIGQSYPGFTGAQAGDVVGMTFDGSTGTLVFYKNGVSCGVAATGLSGPLFPGGGLHMVGDSITMNFGERPFAYPVAGFSAWPGSMSLTDKNAAVSISSLIYTGTGPIFKRSRTRTVIGVEVDTLDITVAPSPSHTLNGAPWLTAARNGALDGASVKLERAFMPAWGDTSAGSVVMFNGRVADIEVGRTQAVIHVQSALELLNVQLPRNVYQPGCLNTVYDGACALSKAAFGLSATVQAGSGKASIVSNSPKSAGYYDLGTITFTSGVNAGVTRSVKQFKNGTFTLLLPLISAPAVGDTFTAYAGCDKTQATCSSKFSNLPNFRGFPYVPAPESII